MVNETMRVLALRGAHVIGTARTPERGREACASVQGKATPVVLELSDFDSVVACAEAIRALDTPIDGLVCNAGVLLTELEQVRGLEMQFVVNHLGHFLLVNRLLDRVTAAPQGRVVVVGSMAHAQVPAGGIQFDNLSGQGWERQAYGHSKLANGLFSFESPAQGAATSCYLASNPSLAKVTGLYFVDCNPAEPSALQKDPALAVRLWQVSEELTRPYLA